MTDHEKFRAVASVLAGVMMAQGWVGVLGGLIIFVVFLIVNAITTRYRKAHR